MLCRFRKRAQARSRTASNRSTTLLIGQRFWLVNTRPGEITASAVSKDLNIEARSVPRGNERYATRSSCLPTTCSSPRFSPASQLPACLPAVTIGDQRLPAYRFITSTHPQVQFQQVHGKARHSCRRQEERRYPTTALPHNPRGAQSPRASLATAAPPSFHIVGI